MEPGTTRVGILMSEACPGCHGPLWPNLTPETLALLERHGLLEEARQEFEAAVLRGEVACRRCRVASLN